MEGTIMATNVPSENASLGQSLDTFKKRQYFLWSLIAICIAGSMLATVGWGLGVYEIVGPEICFYSLVLDATAAIVWLLTIIFIFRRMAPKARRLVTLFGTLLCIGSPILAGYLFVYDPVRNLHSLKFYQSAPKEEIRHVCHRYLVWSPGNDYPSGELMYVGNESSVPYLLWEMPLYPLNKMTILFPWYYQNFALPIITNHSPGWTRDSWVKWYAANKHLTSIEWWADGFTAEGFPVSPRGGDTSIRNLFSALGRIPWCRPDDKQWLTRNAIRMLDLMDRKDVRRMVDKFLQEGSAEERCGVARYANKFDRDISESILRQLIKNDQRPVRLCASGMLSHLQLEWLKNPPGFIEKCHEDAISRDDFFSPSDMSVVNAKLGTHHEAYRPIKGDPKSRIEAVSADSTKPDRPTCIIRIEYPDDEAKTFYEDVATVSIEGISPSTGKTVYSKDLIVTNQDYELRWLYDIEGDSVYISVPDFTCKVDPLTGQIIWEMGFGTDNGQELSLLKDYLVIDVLGDLVICDATHGGILAKYDLGPGKSFDINPLSLVDGRLRATGYSIGLYELKLPDIAKSNGDSSSAVTKPH